MTKPTLKERLDKKYIGKRIGYYTNHNFRYSGLVTEVYPNLRLLVNWDHESARGTMPHYTQVVLLKPKQKKTRVTYEQLAKFWDEKIKPQAHGLQLARNSGAFESLCDLLGVNKND